MEKIIPRWEWRTFAKDFGKAENNIKKCKVTRVLESNEIYIISDNSNDNTKIRDEKMDIKTPLRINTEKNLEQWTVMMKADFPIHINDLVLVFKAFGMPLPYLKKDEYSYQEYLEDIINANSQLHSINVFKKRFGYLIDGCMVEIAEVKFNDVAKRTVAVEQADPELVLRTVKKLALNGFENINYIKAIKDTFGYKY